MLGSKEQRTEGIRRQAQELIDQAYERGFKAGKEAFVTDENKVADKAYQKGLDDAWGCADKLNRMTIDEVRSAFNPFGLTIERESIFLCCTPNIAIAKIKEFEEKQKKAESKAVNVGDEVVFDGGNGVVIDEIGDDEVYILNGLGCVEKIERRLIVKTGRTFPKFAEVFKQLQEGE